MRTWRILHRLGCSAAAQLLCNSLLLLEKDIPMCVAVRGVARGCQSERSHRLESRFTECPGNVPLIAAARDTYLPPSIASTSRASCSR
jgi:hypothetical protein